MVINMLNLNKTISHHIQEHFSLWQNIAPIIAYEQNLPVMELLDNFQSLEQFQQANHLFKLEGTEFTYKKYHSGLRKFITLGYAGHNWAHKDNPQYYSMVDRSDCTFGEKVPCLITVCWFDPFVEVEQVKPGRYQLYLIHGIMQGRTSMVDQAKLNVTLTSENDSRLNIYQDDHWMSRELLSSMPDDKLVKTYITTFEIEKNHQDNDHTIRLQFTHANSWWKNSYYIEGIALVPLKDSEYAYAQMHMDSFAG
eukprot:403333214